MATDRCCIASVRSQSAEFPRELIRGFTRALTLARCILTFSYPLLSENICIRVVTFLRLPTNFHHPECQDDVVLACVDERFYRIRYTLFGNIIHGRH